MRHSAVLKMRSKVCGGLVLPPATHGHSRASLAPPQQEPQRCKPACPRKVTSRWAYHRGESVLLYDVAAHSMNRLTLPGVEEVWENGQAFLDLVGRMDAIAEQREAIETERKVHDLWSCRSCCSCCMLADHCADGSCLSFGCRLFESAYRRRSRGQRLPRAVVAPAWVQEPLAAASEQLLQRQMAMPTASSASRSMWPAMRSLRCDAWLR